MMGARGRLTPVDIVYIAVSVAVLAFGVQPLYKVMSANSDVIPTGALYLFQIIVPTLALVLLSVVFIIAIGGGN